MVNVESTKRGLVFTEEQRQRFWDQCDEIISIATRNAERLKSLNQRLDRVEKRIDLRENLKL